jgi:hypothetical protein
MQEKKIDLRESLGYKRVVSFNSIPHIFYVLPESRPTRWLRDTTH